MAYNPLSTSNFPLHLMMNSEGRINSFEVEIWMSRIAANITYNNKFFMAARNALHYGGSPYNLQLPLATTCVQLMEG
jgi:hypothetical protein